MHFAGLLRDQEPTDVKMRIQKLWEEDKYAKEQLNRQINSAIENFEFVHHQCFTDTEKT